MTNVSWPKIAADEILWIDTRAMVEVDRIMIEELHIELIQMMENAGRNLASLIISLYAPATVAVYAGSGGNGGGGLVAARHLFNRGVHVSVILSRPPDQLSEITLHQFKIVEQMGLAISDGPVAADVTIDALIGYSLGGAPRGRAGELIESLAGGDSPVVALDVPSGVDAGTGDIPGVAMTADATMTLAAPKVGLRGHPHVGRLFVGDISVPRTVYAAMGLSDTLVFDRGPILEITEDKITEEQRR